MYCLAQDLPITIRTFQSCEIQLKLLIGIRVAISEICRFMAIQLYAETQLVVITTRASTVPFEVVLVVLYFSASSEPGVTAILTFNRCQNPHSEVKHRAWLCKVENVKSKLLSLTAFIRRFEEKPLGVAICVRVVLQDQVVLLMWYADRCS